MRTPKYGTSVHRAANAGNAFARGVRQNRVRSAPNGILVRAEGSAAALLLFVCMMSYDVACAA